MPEAENPPVGVVIIDDHMMFAQSLARLLTDEPGIAMLGIATRGSEGLALTARVKPQVVLVDYQMPEQDGVSIAAELKRADERTMVVMVTGSAEDRVLLAAIDAGCSGFLTKDRAVSDVASAVLAVAAGEALITPSTLARLLPKLDRVYKSAGRGLTKRECDLIGFLAQGLTFNMIADELHLSVDTVRQCVQSVLSKLDARTTLEAVATAVREGAVPRPTGR